MNIKSFSGIQIFSFFFFTYLFSWILWAPGVLHTWGIISLSDSMPRLIEALNWIGGIGPSLVAFILVSKNKEEGTKHLFKRILQLKLGYWYFPVILLIPFLLILSHLINLVVFDVSIPVTGLLREPWWIPVVFLIFLILQSSEEFGWRGFALDRLQLKYNALTAAVTVGLLWSVWHLPMFLSQGFPQYQYHLPFTQFALTLISASVIITWLQNNCKGSLFPAFFIHALINFSGEVLPLIEKNKEFQGNHNAWIIVNILLILTVIAVVKTYGYKTLTKKGNQTVTQQMRR